MSPEFEGVLIQIMAQIRDELTYQNTLSLIVEGHKNGNLSHNEYSKALNIFKDEYSKAHTPQS